MGIRDCLRVAAVFVVTAASIGSIQAQSPFEGDGVSGSGRVCTGDLRIHARTLDYDNMLEVCTNTPYRIVKKSADGSTVYQLSPKSHKCHSQILVLHTPTPDAPGGWPIILYGSRESWLKNAANDSLACLMY